MLDCASLRCPKLDKSREPYRVINSVVTQPPTLATQATMAPTASDIEKSDIEAQVHVAEHNGHSTTDDIFKAQDGVSRDTGFLAPLWKVMLMFDRVS
jgi:hypothetical protein